MITQKNSVNYLSRIKNEKYKNIQLSYQKTMINLYLLKIKIYLNHHSKFQRMAKDQLAGHKDSIIFQDDRVIKICKPNEQLFYEFLKDCQEQAAT